MGSNQQSNGQPQAGPPAHMGINFTSTLHHDTYPDIDATGSTGMQGKHVFITGASRGIGKSMAVSYARAGASVIGVSARSDLSEVKNAVEEAALSAGRARPQVVTVEMDVSNQESIQQGIETITPYFDGRLDVLVSNAGYMETWRPIVDADMEDWWKSWEINIRGQILVWKSVVPLLLADDSSLKTIVVMSSIGAQMCTAGASAYQTTKLAATRLSEFLNAEYGEKGLVAFCMHPGSVATELAWKMPEFIHDKLVDTPELMADTVVFLTQERREWLRGRYISCNWDMHEFMGMAEEIVEKDKLRIRMVV